MAVSIREVFLKKSLISLFSVLLFLIVASSSVFAGYTKLNSGTYYFYYDEQRCSFTVNSDGTLTYNSVIPDDSVVGMTSAYIYSGTGGGSVNDNNSWVILPEGSVLPSGQLLFNGGVNNCNILVREGDTVISNGPLTFGGAAGTTPSTINIFGESENPTESVLQINGGGAQAVLAGSNTRTTTLALFSGTLYMTTTYAEAISASIDNLNVSDAVLACSGGPSTTNLMGGSTTNVSVDHGIVVATAKVRGTQGSTISLGGATNPAVSNNSLIYGSLSSTAFDNSVYIPGGYGISTESSNGSNITGVSSATTANIWGSPTTNWWAPFNDLTFGGLSYSNTNSNTLTVNNTVSASQTQIITLTGVQQDSAGATAPIDPLLSVPDRKTLTITSGDTVNLGTEDLIGSPLAVNSGTIEIQGSASGVGPGELNVYGSTVFSNNTTVNNSGIFEMQSGTSGPQFINGYSTRPGNWTNNEGSTFIINPYHYTDFKSVISKPNVAGSVIVYPGTNGTVPPSLPSNWVQGAETNYAPIGGLLDSGKGYFYVYNTVTSNGTISLLQLTDSDFAGWYLNGINNDVNYFYTTNTDCAGEYFPYLIYSGNVPEAYDQNVPDVYLTQNDLYYYNSGETQTQDVDFSTAQNNYNPGNFMFKIVGVNGGFREGANIPLVPNQKIEDWPGYANKDDPDFDPSDFEGQYYFTWPSALQTGNSKDISDYEWVLAINNTVGNTSSKLTYNGTSQAIGSYKLIAKAYDTRPNSNTYAQASSDLYIDEGTGVTSVVLTDSNGNEPYRTISVNLDQTNTYQFGFKAYNNNSQVTNDLNVRYDLSLSDSYNQGAGPAGSALGYAYINDQGKVTFLKPTPEGMYLIVTVTVNGVRSSNWAAITVSSTAQSPHLTGLVPKEEVVNLSFETFDPNYDGNSFTGNSVTPNPTYYYGFYELAQNILPDPITAEFNRQNLSFVSSNSNLNVRDYYEGQTPDDTFGDDDYVRVPNGSFDEDAVITATYTLDNGEEISCEFTINVTPYVAGRAIGAVSNMDFIIGKTSPQNVMATVTPSASTQLAKIEYITSDPTVAQVDEYGTVSAVGVGSAVISSIGTIYNAPSDVDIDPETGSSSYAPTLLSNYVNPAATTVNVTEQPTLSVSPSTASVAIGEEVTLTALLNGDALPEGAVVDWSSSDDTIASVDENGIVTGVSEGDATITASYDEQEATATITVTSEPTTNELVVAPLSVQVGQSAALNVTFNGTAVTEGLTYTIEDEAVASINDETGMVTGLSAGTTAVDVTYTDEDGMEYTATGTITVTAQPSAPTQINVTPANSTITTVTGGVNTTTLTASFVPATYTGTVEWSLGQGQDSIVELTPNGNSVTVTALSEGVANVTASIGNVSGSAVVTVSDQPYTADIAIKASTPDFYNVTVTVNPNVALAGSTQPITSVSIYTWSTVGANGVQNDMNCKFVTNAQGSGTNQYSWDFPVNNTPVNEHYNAADSIKVHVYASTATSASFAGAKQYSWMEATQAANHNVAYVTYSQNVGFNTPTVYDGETSGTQGRVLGMEGLRVSSPIEGVQVQTRVHVEDIGWMEAVGDGVYAGTMGQDKQVEAINLSLTGDNAPNYRIEYRAYVQDHGWMNWVSGGQDAGTTGDHKQIEAVDIRIVPA